MVLSSSWLQTLRFCLVRRRVAPKAGHNKRTTPSSALGRFNWCLCLDSNGGGLGFPSCLWRYKWFPVERYGFCRVVRQRQRWCAITTNPCESHLSTLSLACCQLQLRRSFVCIAPTMRVAISQ